MLTNRMNVKFRLNYSFVANNGFSMSNINLNFINDNPTIEYPSNSYLC